jgi:hypothetical protein
VLMRLQATRNECVLSLHTHLFEAMRVSLSSVHAAGGGVASVAVHDEGDVSGHRSSCQDAAQQALNTPDGGVFPSIAALLLAQLQARREDWTARLLLRGVHARRAHTREPAHMHPRVAEAQDDAALK